MVVSAILEMGIIVGTSTIGAKDPAFPYRMRMAQNTIVMHQLGKDGPDLPAVGFGVMGLAGAYGNPPNEADSFAILDRALELGMTFWDTAEHADPSTLL